MITLIRDAVLDALAVLAPVDCAGCGAPDRSVCAECVAKLQPALTEHHLPDGTPVVSALDYSGIVRTAIIEFKEHGRTDAVRALARPLRHALATVLAGESAAELVCLPTSRDSYRRRGYDPVRMLVRHAGCRSARLLRHTRSTAHQKALDRDGRRANLVGSLSAIRPLPSRRFVLVDDIMTTGSTLMEAARAIREAGGEVSGAVVLAHTARLFPTHRTN